MKILRTMLAIFFGLSICLSNLALKAEPPKAPSQTAIKKEQRKQVAALLEKMKLDEKVTLDEVEAVLGRSVTPTKDVEEGRAYAMYGSSYRQSYSVTYVKKTKRVVEIKAIN